MIMAAVGFIPKVIGNSKAVPDKEPIPGVTPMTNPKKEPTKAANRFWGKVATLNPCNKSEIFSIFNGSSFATL